MTGVSLWGVVVSLWHVRRACPIVLVHEYDYPEERHPGVAPSHAGPGTTI